MVSKGYLFGLRHKTYLVVAGINAVKRRVDLSLNGVKSIKYRLCRIEIFTCTAQVMQS